MTTGGVDFPKGVAPPTPAAPYLPAGPGASGYVAAIFGTPTLPEWIPTAPGDARRP